MDSYRVELKWGLIFFLALLVWMMVERMAGLHGPRIEYHAVFTSLFAVVAVVLYVCALREKRSRALGGQMNWKQGFFAGLGITIVVTVLSPLGQYLIHTFISPDYLENVADYAVEAGMMTREEAASHFTLGSYIVQSAVGAVVMGVITSAVVAWFLRWPRSGSSSESE